RTRPYRAPTRSRTSTCPTRSASQTPSRPSRGGRDQAAGAGPNAARTRSAAAVSRRRGPASRSQRSAREGGRQMTAPRAYYQVPVAEVISETDEACSLVLAVPPELASAFSYRPGQFLPGRVPAADGGSVARCYSLSSSPHTGDAPTITIKRITDGYASNWIADNVRPGTVLDLLPPAGTFSPQSLAGDFLLFAA